MPEITLKEAIEIAAKGLPTGNGRLSTQFGKAVELLIEGGKRIRRKRKDHWVLITPLLPGEIAEE